MPSSFTPTFTPYPKVPRRADSADYVSIGSEEMSANRQAIYEIQDSKMFNYIMKYRLKEIWAGEYSVIIADS